MYNVTDELNRNVNKPDIRKVPANQDQKDGTKIFELADHLTPEQLRILGPRVTQENAEALPLVFGQVYRVCKKSRGNL